MSRRPVSTNAIDCSDLVIDRIGHGIPTRAVDGVTFSRRKPSDLSAAIAAAKLQATK
jgi:hypothetical protein